MSDSPNPSPAFDPARDGVLARISPVARERMLEIASHLRYPRGAEVLAEGGDTAFLGVIEGGRVALRMRIPERGERITFATIEPGEVLGWSALVAPYRATAEAVATEDTEVLAFAAPDLRRLLADDREVAAEVLPLVLDAVAGRLATSWHQLLDTFTTRTFGPW